jgi:signal transduction histidine kinase
MKKLSGRSELQGAKAQSMSAGLSEHQAERMVLRHALVIWSVGFSALFLAVVMDQGGRVWTDPNVIRLEATRFVAAMLIGQCAGRLAWFYRSWTGWRWWALAAALSIGAGATMATVDLLLNWPPPADSGDRVSLLLRVTIFFGWAFGMVVLLVRLGLTGWRIRAQAAELTEARAATAQAQLAMLRYQLNPHFLLNTLNAISTLVVTGRASDAEEMLSKLSGFLRASLTSEPGELVTLETELSMIQEYLDIEGVRFGDRLGVEFVCEPAAADVPVPSLILQPLVENSVKYGVGHSRQPVTIRVEARLDGGDLVVLVSDNGSGPKSDTRSGTGVGLRNVRGRLTATFGAQGTLEAVPLEQGFMTVMRLPARNSGSNPDRQGEVFK